MNLKKIFIVLIFLGIIFCPFPTLAAATSKIGDSCTQWATNDDCELGGANLDCQESTLPKISGNSQYFCTCYNDATCLENYGGSTDGGDWQCISGNSNTNDLSFCKSTKGLIKKIGAATNAPKTCKAKSDCPTDQYCLESTCFSLDELTETSKCNTDADCTTELHKGICHQTLNTGSGDSTPPNVCFFTSTVESTSCGVQQTCNKSTKSCTDTKDCDNLGGAGVCINKFCWLDEVSMKKFKESPSLFGIQADLQIRKPVLEINIPQIKFSDVQNSIDAQGFLHLPYIGEYMSAIYKVGMVVVSIIGVIMIIVVGVKITVMGGEEKVAGFKRIGQIVIGLCIAWGSYTILYNINPDLIQFSALKVKYIEQEPIPDIPDDDNSDAPDGNDVPKTKICNTYNTCKPFCNGTDVSVEKINAAATAKGIKVPEGITEISSLLRTKFQAAGCVPTGAKDSSNEFLNCGLIWHNAKEDRYALPSTADGLVKAALKAKSQGNGISIGTLVRPLSNQVKKVCAWIARNPQGNVKICENAADNSPKPNDADGQPVKGKDNGLACPGTTNHFGGFAVDLNLFSLSDGKHTPLTAQTGTASSCESNAAAESADQNYLKLNEIMFSTGWWKFCQERWHFEYISKGGSMRKNKTTWP